MNAEDAIVEQLIEQLKLIYPDYNLVIKRNTGNGTFIEIENFLFQGIDIGIYSTRIDFRFSKFDLVDYSYLETYLKPRLAFETVQFYYSTQHIKCYLYKHFSSSEAGTFQNAMYRYTVFDFIKKEIEKLLISINKL